MSAPLTLLSAPRGVPDLRGVERCQRRLARAFELAQLLRMVRRGWAEPFRKLRAWQFVVCDHTNDRRGQPPRAQGGLHRRAQVARPGWGGSRVCVCVLRCNSARRDGERVALWSSVRVAYRRGGRCARGGRERVRTQGPPGVLRSGHQCLRAHYCRKSATSS
eukprot:5173762-Pyramimonas_sp.AAC.2